MNKLVYKKDCVRENHDHKDDIDRMIRVLGEDGFSVSRQDVIQAWKDISKPHGTEWMTLPKGDMKLITDLEEILEEPSERAELWDTHKIDTVIESLIDWKVAEGVDKDDVTECTALWKYLSSHGLPEEEANKVCELLYKAFLFDHRPMSIFEMLAKVDEFAEEMKNTPD